jgi:hypothetical protein
LQEYVYSQLPRPVVSDVVSIAVSQYLEREIAANDRREALRVES